MTFDIDEDLISCQCTQTAVSLSQTRCLDASNEGKLTGECVRGPSNPSLEKPFLTLRRLSTATAVTAVTLETDEARRLAIQFRLRGVGWWGVGCCQISGADQTFLVW